MEAATIGFVAFAALVLLGLIGIFGLFHRTKVHKDIRRREDLDRFDRAARKDWDWYAIDYRRR
jgi:hypothetical protein